MLCSFNDICWHHPLPLGLQGLTFYPMISEEINVSKSPWDMALEELEIHASLFNPFLISIDSFMLAYLLVYSII